MSVYSERETQNRVVSLLADELGYEYLGKLNEGDNPNVREGDLEHFLVAYQNLGGDERGEVLRKRAIEKLVKTATDTSKSLYERNAEVYGLLRYGVKVSPGVGEKQVTVWPIDWENPERNRFAIAEEVSVHSRQDGGLPKRPDIVLYVNGIALGVLELKRASVSVSEGIRQNLDNQKKEFIQHFFSTMQFVMAGNDIEGLRYGTILTPEKYYLTWKEEGPDENPLDRALRQLCSKDRFLEFIHDFIVFDGGVKKLCRHNQYFGVKAAQPFVKRREGGIIWHTQGSGKSLTMVWLARWIRENVEDARVLIITDRTELDEQIERVFRGVGEGIVRTRSGRDLIAKLGDGRDWLVCSLIHKFGGKDEKEGDVRGYVAELTRALPKDFKAKGEFFVFVDECHRTQSGDLHDAMKAILPNAVFIGFTGTPLLKSDKKKSVEVFGRYIHTYKFDEAVRDGVVLDLRYEARDIDQIHSSPELIDEWFEAKTRGLTPLAKAQLKKRWGTMQAVLSSRSRLQRIVDDIVFDMGRYDRLLSGRGNAMLVAGSIYEACKFYELFAKTELRGKCAVVTSYEPNPRDIKGEETGEGQTEKIEQYEIYRQMLADFFDEPADKAIRRAPDFERIAKKKFIEEPSQMKLLIVVDKLLTGFDAPSATYLYIDKQMRDHGLFQAICRVNRLDGEDKEYGYIIDYKDLFRSVAQAVHDYTGEAFSGYDKADVEGLLKDRLEEARKHLDDALETMRALVEAVEPPRDSHAYCRYFSAKERGNAEELRKNEAKRLNFYQLTSKLIRAYAALANEMEEAGYSKKEAEAIKAEIAEYEELREVIKLHSGDAIDLKRYEPAMRHLIDTYIRAKDSETLSGLEDLSLLDLIAQRGVDAVDALSKRLRGDETTTETIENNLRKLIVNETPINPKYYEKMSKLLDALIEERKRRAKSYAEYLEKLVELTRRVKHGPAKDEYPTRVDTPAKRALYDNLDRDEERALRVHEMIVTRRQDDWRNHPFKRRAVLRAIEEALVGDAEPSEEEAALIDRVFELAKNQDEY